MFLMGGNCPSLMDRKDDIFMSITAKTMMIITEQIVIKTLL